MRNKIFDKKRVNHFLAWFALIFLILLSLNSTPSVPGTSTSRLWENSDSLGKKTIDFLLTNYTPNTPRKILLLEADSYNRDRWMESDQWQRIIDSNLSTEKSNPSRLSADYFSIVGGQINEIVVPEIREVNRITALSQAANANFVIVRVPDKSQPDLFPTTKIQKSYNHLRKKLIQHINFQNLEDIGLKQVQVNKSRNIDSIQWNSYLLEVRIPQKWQNFVHQNICNKETSFAICLTSRDVIPLATTGLGRDSVINFRNGLVVVSLKPNTLDFGLFYIHWDPQQQSCPFMVSDQVIWGENGQISFFLKNSDMKKQIRQCKYSLNITRPLKSN